MFWRNKKLYNEWKKQCELEGKPVPLNEGVLIFDEVKVQGKIIWNSSSGKIIGLAITPEEFTNLHDVYMTLVTDRNSRPTEYVLQFLWRDISCKFDVIGPYYTSDKGMDSRFLLLCVFETMRVFEVYEFTTCGLVCDGASSNLKLAKHFCFWAGAFGECPIPNSYKKYEVPHKFPNPFRRNVMVYLIICPSHQLKNMIASLYSSRKGGTKKFSKDGTDFGWEPIVQLYEDDMKRAEKGCSMAVPDMKESYVIRDAWTRLNVKPAKIMQQNDVIQALNEKKDHTNNYLKACNALFEEGILKKTPVTGTDSEPIKNIKKGFSFFEERLDDILEQVTRT